jgi:WD40 repeat protein
VVSEPREGHTGSVWCLAFSPDGRRIASGSSDNTIRLWDVETGAAVGEPLKGHTESVSCLAFSPDGRRIASGSYDKTIRLWDPHTGGTVGEPILLQSYPSSLFLYTQNHDLFLVINGRIVYNLSMNTPSLHYGGSPPPDPIADTQIEYDTPWIFFRSRFYIRFQPPSNFQMNEYKIHQRKIAYGGWDGSVMIVDGSHLY